MLQLMQIMDYEIDSTKIIWSTEFANEYSERKQRCWASDLRTVITPERMYRCTYSRGGMKMPLPRNVEEFIIYRNALNMKEVCSKECTFCTKNKLNLVVDELINNPSYMKEIIEKYTDEVIDDEEWI